MGGARILAIDPGSERSGWVLYSVDERRVLLAEGETPNAILISMLRRSTQGEATLAIETFQPRGQPLYRQLVDTAIWTGRFAEAWASQGGRVELVPREAVKRAVLGTTKGSDANVRAALLDLHGGAGACGTRKAPGPLHGVKTHAWAALAVAVTVAGLRPEPLRLVAAGGGA